jgi:hypothetical protein
MRAPPHWHAQFFMKHMPFYLFGQQRPLNWTGLLRKSHWTMPLLLISNSFIYFLSEFKSRFCLLLLGKVFFVVSAELEIGRRNKAVFCKQHFYILAFMMKNLFALFRICGVLIEIFWCFFLIFVGCI